MIKGERLNIPKHVAIIMDGNGRWAKKRLLPRSLGHKQGVERMQGLLEYAYERGVEHVTLYALSTENLLRPQEEVEGLFDLMRNRFKGAFDSLKKYRVRARIIGNVSLLPKDVQEILKSIEEESRQYEGEGKSANLAIAYGSRAEIVRAVNLAIARGEIVTEESFSSMLYTAGVPDPDLIIRTGKEKRLSNFLLYQAAYSEFYFSDKMFPDFSDKDLEKAFEEYSKRTRRFGKTDEQIQTEEEGKE